MVLQTYLYAFKNRQNDETAEVPVWNDDKEKQGF